MSQQNATGWVNDLSVARALTWRYVIALSLVAMLSTAAWVSLHLVIAAQKSTAAVVNVSGRQRMLSQRTALFANLLASSPRAERPLVRSKLKEAIELMARSHNGLTHGDQAMGLPDSMSPAVRAMYFDGPHPLDAQVEAYIKAVRALLVEDDAALTPGNPLLQYITRTAPSTLVTALDQMVSQYQLEGEEAVGHLQKAETIFWVVTLLLLMLEAALIFHPFVRHVRSIIGKLQRVTDELQLHQGHLQDLVEQRTAELESRGKELAESEEKFRLISTAAKDAIMIIGADAQVIYWNPAAETIFGYKADEALGRNLHSMLTPERYREAAYSGFKLFQDSGEGNVIGKTFEISALRKNGEEFPIELSISAVRLQDSWHAIGIIRDITERKKTEEAFRENEARMRTLVRTIPDMVWLKDTHGVYLACNPAFERMLGAQEADIVGKTDYDFLGQDLADYFRNQDMATIANGGASSNEGWVTFAADGSRAMVQTTKTPMRATDGQIIGVLGIGRDITELRNLNATLEQRVLERTAELETAIYDLESFNYSASHDLRIPLRAVDGFSKILLDEYSQRLDAEGVRLLHVVRDHTRKMAQLIDDMQIFSRTGRLAMAPVTIDMEVLVREVVDELKPVAAGREIRLQINKLPPAVADPAMMRRVMLNLISNAIKFTRPRMSALIEVGAKSEGAEVIYYVRDNGVGFDMLYADKLFGLFQRLHGPAEFEGAGIGLAIVKRIITRQGGQVWAEGKVNEGATVYFTLPRNAAA